MGTSRMLVCAQQGASIAALGFAGQHVEHMCMKSIYSPVLYYGGTNRTGAWDLQACSPRGTSGLGHVSSYIFVRLLACRIHKSTHRRNIRCVAACYHFVQL